MRVAPFKGPLPSVATVAGTAVGLLYVIGAIAKIEEVHGRGLDARDVLTLIPIQQLLARGVGVSLQAALLGAMALVLFGVIETGILERNRQSAWVKARSSRGLVVLVCVALLNLVVVVLFLAFVPLVLLAVSVPGGALLAYVNRRSRPGGRRAILALLMITTIAVVLIVSYFGAPLLATAIVTMKNGTEVRGKFIAESDGNWYLSPRRQTLVAIRGDDVTKATICARPRRQSPHVSRSLIEIITGDHYLRSIWVVSASKALCP